MKKLIITESQYNNLKKSLIKENQDVYSEVMTDVIYGRSKIVDVKRNHNPVESKNSFKWRYVYDVYLSHKIPYTTIFTIGFYRDDYFCLYVTVLDMDGNVVLKNDRDGFGELYRKYLKDEIVKTLQPIQKKEEMLGDAYDEKDYQDSMDWENSFRNTQWDDNDEYQKSDDLDKFDNEIEKQKLIKQKQKQKDNNDINYYSEFTDNQ